MLMSENCRQSRQLHYGFPILKSTPFHRICTTEAPVFASRECATFAGLVKLGSKARLEGEQRRVQGEEVFTLLIRRRWLQHRTLPSISHVIHHAIALESIEDAQLPVPESHACLFRVHQQTSPTTSLHSDHIPPLPFRCSQQLKLVDAMLAPLSLR